MNSKNDGSGIVVTIIILCIFGFVGMLMEDSTPKCIKSGCDNDQVSGSSYCYLHKSYSGSSSYKRKSSSYSTTSTTQATTYNSQTKGYKKKYTSLNPYSSYDEGYEDVYEDEDYDWDRYYSDDDYRDGVDDAMDELDW